MVPFIIQGDNIVVFSGGAPVTVNSTHINYTKLLDALKSQDWDAIPGLLTVKEMFKTLSYGDVTFDGETLMYKNKVMEGALASRLMKMFTEGFPIDHLMKFIDRLNKNPSYRAIQELYGFLEANSLPITDDGCFLAYKRIRADWTDCHSGTMDNSIGTVVEMPRNEVDDNRDNTCSNGLHFCGYTYLRSFGGARVVVLKIDPADVVSIPSDYNNQKGRACRYTVVEEIVDADQAVNDDCLGNGPSVVAPKPEQTGYWSEPSALRNKSVEEVYNGLSNYRLSDFRQQLEFATDKSIYRWSDEECDLSELLAVWTYREIWEAMRALDFI